jgi:hypothetical protein
MHGRGLSTKRRRHEDELARVLCRRQATFTGGLTRENPTRTLWMHHRDVTVNVLELLHEQKIAGVHLYKAFCGLAPLAR